MCETIDAVFTWVDGTDPAHQEKRRRYAHEADSSGTCPDAAHQTRFADTGELWYSIRLLRANAPWIDDIYIVADNQRPKWLTPGRESELRAQVVDHKTIFRGYEEYLPTFNGRSIEAVLHRIPGLAKKFIAFNDDVFLVNRAEPSDYFRSAKPLISGLWVWRNRLLRWTDRSMRALMRREDPYVGLVGSRGETIYGDRSRDFRVYHTPKPIDKDRFDFYMTEEVLRDTLQYRFRHPDQISPLAYYANRALAEGEGYQGKPDLAYMSPRYLREDLDAWLHEKVVRKRRKHLCLQSVDQFSASQAEEAYDFLERLLQGPQRTGGGVRMSGADETPPR